MAVYHPISRNPLPSVLPSESQDFDPSSGLNGSFPFSLSIKIYTSRCRITPPRHLANKMRPVLKKDTRRYRSFCLPLNGRRWRPGFQAFALYIRHNTSSSQNESAFIASSYILLLQSIHLQSKYTTYTKGVFERGLGSIRHDDEYCARSLHPSKTQICQYADKQALRDTRAWAVMWRGGRIMTRSSMKSDSERCWASR